jgi:hypothetical protein
MNLAKYEFEGKLFNSWKEMDEYMFQLIYREWERLGKIPENADDKDIDYFDAFAKFIIEYKERKGWNSSKFDYSFE